jgi:hypothetical protein
MRLQLLLLAALRMRAALVTFLTVSIKKLEIPFERGHTDEDNR